MLMLPKAEGDEPGKDFKRELTKRKKKKEKRMIQESIPVGHCLLDDLHLKSFYKKIIHRKGWKCDCSCIPVTVKHPELCVFCMIVLIKPY